MKIRDKFLVVKLDQYAGNVDEIVCVALTGHGAERYGEKQAREVFDEKVLPLLASEAEDFDSDYPEFPVEFMDFNTEYGSMPYELDFGNKDALRLGIDNYTKMEQINQMLDIWTKAYGNDEGQLVITVENIHRKTVTVKILGFDLITVTEQRETLR